MILIVLTGFLLNRNKLKYYVLPDPCAGVVEVPGTGCARLIIAHPLCIVILAQYNATDYIGLVLQLVVASADNSVVMTTAHGILSMPNMKCG